MYFRHTDFFQFRAFPGFSKLGKNPGATSKPVANGENVCHSRNKEALHTVPIGNIHHVCILILAIHEDEE